MNVANEKQVTKFRALLEELRKQLLDACTHFDIYVQLWPTKEVVDVVNRYRGFFQPTFMAHFDRFSMKICNVVSNKSSQPSFYRIFNMLDSNTALAPGIDIQSLRERLENHRKVINAIKVHRDKKAAHFDMKISIQRKPILFGECKRMLEELQAIFNEISRAHSGQVWSFKYSQQSNTSSFLNALKIK